VLIERALRDEGTSVHYQPPGRWSRLDPRLRERLDGAFNGLPEPVLTGASWTNDAPYRETADQIAAARLDGAVCVEMRRPPCMRTPPPLIARWCAWPT